MENIALIITHLVAVSDVEEMEKSAADFKTINIEAASEDHCICHLEDEDETPEIVRPGVATLFVSFTIWDNFNALEVFLQKVTSDYGINIEEFISTRWSITDGNLPSLNEAFGRIWISRHFSASAQLNVLPFFVQSAGRRWLMDNLGNTENPFVYDQWKIRRDLNSLPKTANEMEAPKINQQNTTKIALTKQPFGYFIKPFGVKNNNLSPKAPDEIEKKIQEFDQSLSGYNAELEKWLKEYSTLDYARLATLVNWAQNAINFIVEQIPAGNKYAESGDLVFLEKIKTEEKKWRDAQMFFAQQRETQYNIEVQQALNKTGIYEYSLEQQKKRADIANSTNQYLLNTHKELLESRQRSFQESNEAWKRAFFGR